MLHTHSARGAIALALAAALMAAATGSACAQSTTPSPTQSPTGSSTGPSGSQAAPGGRFARQKQKELDHIQARIQIMQTLQSCVQSANDHAAVKACNQAARQSVQAQKGK